MADELRFRRLREAMQRERLDALVCRLPDTENAGAEVLGPAEAELWTA